MYYLINYDREQVFHYSDSRVTVVESWSNNVSLEEIFEEMLDDIGYYYGCATSYDNAQIKEIFMDYDDSEKFFKDGKLDWDKVREVYSSLNFDEFLDRIDCDSLSALVFIDKEDVDFLINLMSKEDMENTTPQRKDYDLVTIKGINIKG